jgi:hypothetical protein
MLVAGATLLIVRHWLPFIMQHVEDELSLVISTKILLIAVLESF